MPQLVFHLMLFRIGSKSVSRSLIFFRLIHLGRIFAICNINTIHLLFPMLFIEIRHSPTFGVAFFVILVSHNPPYLAAAGSAAEALFTPFIYVANSKLFLKFCKSISSNSIIALTISKSAFADLYSESANRS